MAVKLETIKKRKDFLSVAKSGKKYLGDFFIMQTLLKNNQNQTRFGFTITKKVAKSAVVRNAVRRKMKEIIRNLEHVANGYDIVFVMRYKSLDASFWQMEDALKNQIKKLEKGN